MPSARIRRESFQAGGTTSAPDPETEGGRSWLLWAGLGVVAVGAIVVAVLVFGGGKPQPTAATDDDGTDEPVAAGVDVPDLEAPIAPPVAPVRLDPLRAADDLERQLATERLFAKSSLRGTELELRSEFCAQARLRAIVGGAVADLRAQGLTSLLCLELHGAVVFTQPL